MLKLYQKQLFHLEEFQKNLNLFSRFLCSLPRVDKLVLDRRKELENRWKNKISYPLNTAFNLEKDDKYYLLSMFPYPSGELHMGHVRVYTVSDAMARYHSMNGKKVIHPMGWDAFGLPAENAAIDRKQQTEIWTKRNIASMKEQLLQLGITFDWSREFATCDPSYYKWTQYLFLQMYHRGLAYRQKALVNWDPVDQTVLADEQIDENGCSWRSGAKVVKRHLRQWFLHTTAFSKALYDDLDNPNLEHWSQVKAIQRNWIGICSGFVFDVKLIIDGKEMEDFLTIWTETPELLFGATYVTVSPNHYLNNQDYCVHQTKHESEFKLLVEAVHPFTGEYLPIYVSDKFDYPATGNCYIGIPGEIDEDQMFAMRHNLKMVQVINKISKTLINSGKFTGMDLPTAKEQICKTAQEIGIGGFQSSKKLRNWLISRQRYWGTPIPMIHCPTCKEVPVPYDQLPVELPFLKTIVSKGVSPLAAVDEWINVNCPRCGNPAKRETDTMDTFVDSAWYYLRFLDPHNEKEPFNSAKVNSLLPVDLYIGGIEHADVHLYYARFFSHLCHSFGWLQTKEPFRRLLCQGYVKGKTYCVEETGKYLKEEEVDTTGGILLEKKTGKLVVMNWEKMSKSKFNGVSPNIMVEEHGVDTTRLGLLAFVPPDKDCEWIVRDIYSALKLQRKLFTLVEEFQRVQSSNLSTNALTEKELIKWRKILHEFRNSCIKKVAHHFETTHQLNVSVRKLQQLYKNIKYCPKEVIKYSEDYEKALAALIIMLTPFAPHFSSELWSKFVSVAKGYDGYDISKPVIEQKWPKLDADYKLSLLINIDKEEVAKLKITLEEMASYTKEKALQLAFSLSEVQKLTKGKTIIETLYQVIPKHKLVVEINTKSKDESCSIEQIKSL